MKKLPINKPPMVFLPYNTTGYEVPMEEESKPVARISSLADARKKVEDEHADKVMRMLREDPKLLQNVILISPYGADGPTVISNPDMSVFETVGILEFAKTILLSEDEDGDEDDDGDG